MFTMKIYNAVRTNEKALQIMATYSPEKPRKCTLRCTCGETPGYLITNAPGIAFVAVCDACGNDDQDNVISILK